MGYHKRERLITVSILNNSIDFDFNNLIKRPMTPMKDIVKHEDLKGCIINQPSMLKAVENGKMRAVYVDDPKSTSNTITCNQVRWNAPMVEYGDGWRVFTARECWLLMGFSESDYLKASKVCSKTQLYKQAGNSIVVPMLESIFIELYS